MVSTTSLLAAVVGHSGFFGIDCMYGPLSNWTVLVAFVAPVTSEKSVIWFQKVAWLKVPAVPTSGAKPGRKSLCWSLISAIWLRMLCTNENSALCFASMRAIVYCWTTFA